MTEKEAMRLARQELDRCRKAFRCPLLDDYSAVVSRRLKSLLGQCDCQKRRITISARHIERDSMDEIVDTIRHEIAHALTHWDEARKGIKHDSQYRRHHNDLFYAWCVKVGCAPKRCASLRRPLHADEEPRFILGCRCCRTCYKRLDARIRTDETGQVFSYHWVRHEFWESKAAYEEYILKVFGEHKRDCDPADIPKPVRIEFDLQRTYWRCRFHQYRHEPYEKPCNQPVYLYHYDALSPVLNFRIDDVPPQSYCTGTSHYPGDDDDPSA